MTDNGRREAPVVVWSWKRAGDSATASCRRQRQRWQPRPGPCVARPGRARWAAGPIRTDVRPIPLAALAESLQPLCSAVPRPDCGLHRIDPKREGSAERSCLAAGHGEHTGRSSTQVRDPAQPRRYRAVTEHIRRDGAGLDTTDRSQDAPDSCCLWAKRRLRGRARAHGGTRCRCGPPDGGPARLPETFARTTIRLG